MTEALSSIAMQHAFAHTDDAVSLPSLSPASTTSRTLPPSAADDHLDLQSPPASQPVVPPWPQNPFSTSAHAVVPVAIERELTPPSSSAFSCQGHASVTATTSPNSAKVGAQRSLVAAGNHEAESTRSSTGSPTRGDASREVLSGPKRTANGEIKRSSITGIQDLKTEANGPRHSRTSSILSNGSNGSVMELSQQLRTRLNYAMVKVQNGWQTRSLEEVESLASQSPRSTVSGFQHAPNGHTITSPRTAMSVKLQRKWSSSESSDGGNASRPQTSDLDGVYPNGRHYQAGQMMARRALAPPADIVPGSRRRAAPNGYSANGTHVAGLQLNTHISRPKSKQRTPSQNAAMEADAVETLLFMASPNNSGHHPSTFGQHESSLRSTQSTTMSQTSPLREQFRGSDVLFSPKKVAFAPQTAQTGKVYDKAGEIERMLDELDDDSSDDLQEAFDVSQRRRVPGPVV